MEHKIILETERLILREQNTDDAAFILELLNTPNWLEFIGDRNVKSIEAAKKYIEDGAMASYKKDGFGFWAMVLKGSHTPIGVCGLVKRDTLDDIDVGFGLLPKYANAGYGFEAASATMNYAKKVLKINRIVGITDPKNIASIKLLSKIGLQFETTLNMSENDEVLLFGLPNKKNDQVELDSLTANFFDLFTNKNGKKPKVQTIKDIFIQEGIIISNNAPSPEIYNLDEFIKPREEMLTNGALTDFSESEISHETKIYKNVAQRFCLYEKSGKLNDNYFSTKGMKTIQFIKVNGNWKMSSVAWSDDN